MQSFNLDCGRLDNTSGTATSSGGNVTKTNVAYLRTLSAPTPSPSHYIYQQLHYNHGNKATCGNGTSGGSKKLQRNSLAGGIFNATFDQHHHHLQQQLQQQQLTNFQSNEAALNALTTASDCSKTTNDTKSTMSTKITPTTILKIEETLPSSTSLGNGAFKDSTSTALSTDLETLQQKRLRQLNIEMDNIRNMSIDQSQQLSALMQQNHYCTGSGNNASNNNNKHKNLMTTSSSSSSFAMLAAIPKKVPNPCTNNPPYSTATSNVTCVAGKPVNSNPLTQHNPVPASASATATSYLLHGSDATKKGSTSTIWTSEESILRSVGAVDEDNK